jgi:hypothetical protein
MKRVKFLFTDIVVGDEVFLYVDRYGNNYMSNSNFYPWSFRVPVYNVRDENKFKIGDRVTSLKTFYVAQEGDTGTVVNYMKSGQLLVHIDRLGYETLFEEDWLQLTNEK